MLNTNTVGSSKIAAANAPFDSGHKLVLWERKEGKWIPDIVTRIIFKVATNHFSLF
jgi:hypothetical protein